MYRKYRLLLGISLAALASAAQAQDIPVTVPAKAAAPDPDADIAPEVEVVGARERGAVPGDIKPDLQLSPADIRSYGVSSISDLMTELGSQTRSDQGRSGGSPVVLLNGRRIANFSEIRDIPVEAIERVDILPEEAGLKFGFPADQKVVNIVLRRRFRAVTGEATGGGTTDGGRFTGGADANIVHISRDRRLTINMHYDGDTNVTEADRNLIATTPAIPYKVAGNVSSATAAGTTTADNIAAFRDLLPATRNLSTNSTYSRTVFGDVTATLNGSFATTISDTDLGLSGQSYSVPSTNPFATSAQAVTVNRYFNEVGPQQRSVDGDTEHLSVSLNGDVKSWRWSAISNYDRVFSRTLTDTTLDLTSLQARINAGDPTLNPFGLLTAADLGHYGQDSARSTTSTGSGSFLAGGPLFALPAGKVNTSLKIGFSSSDFDSQATRSGVPTATSLSRDSHDGQISLDVPLTKRNGFLGAIGTLSVNGNYAVDHLSDFGTLTTYGYGLNYSPVNAIRLLATTTYNEGAPTVAQLGSPLVTTTNVRTFDYVTGTSVYVTSIDGGNRALTSDNRRVYKLGLTIKPWSAKELTLTANFVSTRTLNPIASFPSATSAIEAAFPDRFMRDASGTLLRIDNRPINFARENTSELRWGINFSKRIGPIPPPRGAFGRFRPPEGGPPPGEGGPPPGGGGPGGGGPGGGGGGPGGGGGGGRGFGGGGFGGPPGAGGRLQFAVYHTWHFRDEILIRQGVPVLDLLNGQATGSSGGQSRHEIEVQAGFLKSGMGARISGNWQSGTFVQGGTAVAPTALNFSGLATLNLRLFADLSPRMTIVRQNPWLRGVRVSFNVTNLFDTKLHVTDGTGAVPVNYQPDLLDPTGRAVKLSVRKLFF